MKAFKIIIIIVLLSPIFLVADNLEQSDLTYHKSNFGVGLGIPYGIIGSSFDLNVTPHASISFGMGTTVIAGMAYNFGLKYYFTSPHKSFRPRVSAYYGINAMVEKESYYGIINDGESFSGLSLALGSQWMWGKSKSNGLDFDVVFIVTTGLDIDELRMQGYDVNEPGKVKISLGYRHSL